jgi:hypothetical protein
MFEGIPNSDNFAGEKIGTPLGKVLKSLVAMLPLHRLSQKELLNRNFDLSSNTCLSD